MRHSAGGIAPAGALSALSGGGIQSAGAPGAAIGLDPSGTNIVAIPAFRLPCVAIHAHSRPPTSRFRRTGDRSLAAHGTYAALTAADRL